MTKVWLLLTMAGVGFAQICLVEPPAIKPVSVSIRNHGVAFYP
jgi:hypothetical protein